MRIFEHLNESAKKLRNSLTSIIERYSKSFEDEADEIDLASLTIVKSNGHLAPKGRSLPRSTVVAATDLRSSAAVSIGSVSVDSFDEAELLLLYEVFIHSRLNWKFAGSENFRCKEHAELNQECFACCLEDAI